MKLKEECVPNYTVGEAMAAPQEEFNDWLFAHEIPELAVWFREDMFPERVFV